MCFHGDYMMINEKGHFNLYMLLKHFISLDRMFYIKDACHWLLLHYKDWIWRKFCNSQSQNSCWSHLLKWANRTRECFVKSDLYIYIFFILPLFYQERNPLRFLISFTRMSWDERYTYDSYHPKPHSDFEKCIFKSAGLPKLYWKIHLVEFLACWVPFQLFSAYLQPCYWPCWSLNTVKNQDGPKYCGKANRMTL